MDIFYDITPRKLQVEEEKKSIRPVCNTGNPVERITLNLVGAEPRFWLLVYRTDHVGGIVLRPKKGCNILSLADVKLRCQEETGASFTNILFQQAGKLLDDNHVFDEENYPSHPLFLVSEEASMKIPDIDSRFVIFLSGCGLKQVPLMMKRGASVGDIQIEIRKQLHLNPLGFAISRSQKVREDLPVEASLADLGIGNRRVLYVFTQPHPFQVIPKPAVFEVLKHLDARTLAMLRSVDRRFRDAVDDDRLWRPLILDTFGLPCFASDSYLEGLFQLYCNIGHFTSTHKFDLILQTSHMGNPFVHRSRANDRGTAFQSHTRELSRIGTLETASSFNTNTGTSRVHTGTSKYYSHGPSRDPSRANTAAQHVHSQPSSRHVLSQPSRGSTARPGIERVDSGWIDEVSKAAEIGLGERFRPADESEWSAAAKADADGWPLHIQGCYDAETEVMQFRILRLDRRDRRLGEVLFIKPSETLFLQLFLISKRDFKALTPIVRMNADERAYVGPAIDPAEWDYRPDLLRDEYASITRKGDRISFCLLTRHTSPGDASEEILLQRFMPPPINMLGAARVPSRASSSCSSQTSSESDEFDRFSE
eukprot:Rmarinus@m.24527